MSRAIYEFVVEKRAKLLEHLAVSLAEFILRLDPRIQKVIYFLDL